MSTETYLFEVYTQTSAGARWTLNLMASIHDREQEIVEDHGRWISEEVLKQEFPSFFRLDRLGPPPIKEEDVDWELFYTMLRDWYKRAKSSDNTTSTQKNSRAEAKEGNTANPFQELKSRDKDGFKRKYFDEGLQIANRYHPIVTRVIQLYSDFLPKDFTSSYGEIEYSQFLPKLTGNKSNRIYSWVLFADEPTSDIPYILEVELACTISQVYYLAIRLRDIANKQVDKNLDFEVSDEELEHDLVNAIKSLHNELYG